MNKVMLVLIALIAAAPAALAQDGNTLTVCGVPLKADGVLAWTSFRTQPLPSTPDELYESLQKVLDARSADWTKEVKTHFSDAFKELSSGSMTPATFVVSKDAATFRTFAFQNNPRAFELPSDKNAAKCVSNADRTSRIEAANFILLVQRAIVEFNKDAFKSAALQIKSLEETYDSYLFEGFPMFPWEALVNSWVLTDKHIANGPPRNALVFLHPAAGFVGSVDSNTSSDIGGVLSIEPIGWIRYSANYKSWYGASLLAVFPSDREAGYGVTLNYEKFKLGVTWHDDDDPKHEGLAVFLGFDLYRLLGKENRNYDDYKDKLKNLF